MGVPSYFAWIMKLRRKYQLKNILHPSLNRPTKRLYLDYNCGIHKACRQTKTNDLNDMINNCAALIEELLALVKPTELLFISIDGSVPMGKCKQQRYRRFKTVQEQRMIREIKQKASDDQPVDFNMISPGTEFMIKLSDYIKVKIDQWKQKYPSIQFILSDSLIPGEGEQKIVQHMKASPPNSMDGVVIYGLDADLIFLSLGLHHPSMYLIRENVNKEHVENQDHQFSVPDYIYLNIGDLRENIIKLVTQSENLIKLNKTEHEQYLTTMSVYSGDQIINDYIFINFLLGNDFVSKIYSLSIREGSCEVLLQIYRVCLRSQKQHLVTLDDNDDVSINVNFLQQMLTFLVEYERNYWKDPPKIHVASLKKHLELTETEEEIEKYQFIDATRQNLQLNLSDPNFRSKYYHRLFSLDSNCSLETNIKQICSRYWYALRWVSRYYFRQCHDWDWYYRYEYAPLISDLLNYGANQINENTLATISKPIDVLHQLMIILPPSSFAFLPRMFKRILQSSQFSSFFPKYFQYHYYGHAFLWECPPKIPILDNRSTKEMYDYILCHLNDEENKNNHVGCLYVN